MFIVIEHLLPSLDHLVAHILDLCHSLHKDTQKTHGQHSSLHIILHLMSKLRVLQSRIYITMSLPETRSLLRGEVCMHPAYQPLGAGSAVKGPRLIRIVYGRVPEWMPT